jgi:hypothetical protein
MSTLMRNWPGEWERGKWLQYAGWRKESFFIGMGEQNKKRHAVCHASGYLAHTMHPVFLEWENWYSTRIDIQRTVKKPEWVDLHGLYTHLGKNGVSLISSEENDTLYIGSRTSDKFIRLYEKMYDEMYLRLEFELKGSRAAAAWQALINGEECDRVFDYYLGKLKLPEGYIKLFKNIDHKATERAMRIEVEHNAEKKLKWIISLDATMRKAIADHDIGERTKTIIRSWAKHADKIDINS